MKHGFHGTNYKHGICVKILFYVPAFYDLSAEILSLADKRDKRVDYRKLTRNYFKFKLR